MNKLKLIVANVGALLLVPTTALAFVAGVLTVLHVRAFVHGWNVARKT